MATALKLRRGTTAQHASFTGAEGEVTVDTTKDTVVVHDGSTAGGFPLAKETGSTIAVAAGTVSAPSLTTSGDTNTGVYFPAADTVGVATGGAERLRIDSSGNVGIGTTSVSVPSGKALEVYDATLPRIKLTNSTTGTTSTDGCEINVSGSDFNVTNREAGNTIFNVNGAERMRITSAGDVGIGASAPAAKLEISSTNGGVTDPLLANTRLRFTDSDTTKANNQVTGGIEWYTADTDAAGVYAYISSATNSAGNGYVTFATGSSATIAERMRIDPSGNVGIGTSSPAQRLEVASATGGTIGLRYVGNSGYATIGTDGNNQILFSIGNPPSERMRIDSSGNLCVGQTGTTGRVGITSTTTDNSAYGIYIQDSASALMFYVRNDGVFLTGTKTGSPYNNTTASAANMFVSSAGALQRSTSSLKYKTNVQDATHGLAEVLTLRPVTYEGKAESDVGKTFGGLIAEEVHEAGLTEFVQYADDGSPDALAYGNMVSLCVKAIQELNAKVEAQAAEIAQLKGN